VHNIATTNTAAPADSHTPPPIFAACKSPGPRNHWWCSCDMATSIQVTAGYHRFHPQKCCRELDLLSQETSSLDSGTTSVLTAVKDPGDKRACIRWLVASNSIRRRGPPDIIAEAWWSGKHSREPPSLWTPHRTPVCCRGITAAFSSSSSLAALAASAARPMSSSIATADAHCWCSDMYGASAAHRATPIDNVSRQLAGRSNSPVASRNSLPGQDDVRKKNKKKCRAASP